MGAGLSRLFVTGALLLGWLLAGLLGCTPAWAEEEALAPGELLYREALLDLQEDHTEQAIAKLQRLVAEQPAHLGAQLDLAIAFCHAGQGARAEALWSKLETAADLPPTIGELIAYYRQRGCALPEVPWRGFIAAGLGYGENINQAPGDALFYLPPLGVSLRLTGEARPRQDSFRQVEAAWSRPSRAGQWGLGGWFQHIDYVHASEFDSDQGQVFAHLHQALGGGSLEMTGSVSFMTLGHHAYSRGAAGQLASWFPLDQEGRWRWGGVLGVTGLDYVDLPDYQARMSEVRGRLEWMPVRSARIRAEAGWLQDKALRDRPGGDKSGPVLQLSVNWQPGARSALEVFHRQTWLKEEEAYSPGFFGPVRRDSHQSLTYAAWRQVLSDHWVLRLEGRLLQNKDSIALFEYRSSSLGLMLEWWPR